MTLSPSFAFIERTGATITLECARCRAMVPLAVVPLVRAFRGDCRVDDAPLPCPVCGAFGTPWVQGSGNMTVGKPHFWPPSPHHALAESD